MTYYLSENILRMCPNFVDGNTQNSFTFGTIDDNRAKSRCITIVGRSNRRIWRWKKTLSNLPRIIKHIRYADILHLRGTVSVEFNQFVIERFAVSFTWKSCEVRVTPTHTSGTLAFFPGMYENIASCTATTVCSSDIVDNSVMDSL